jgi:hypothetical protein
MLLGLLGLLTALVNAHMPVGRPPLRRRAHRRLDGLLGAPIMLVLFLLFPRWRRCGARRRRHDRAQRPVASMQVGTIAELALDDSIAMRIKFDGTAAAASRTVLPRPGAVQLRRPRVAAAATGHGGALSGVTANLPWRASRCATRSRWSPTTGPGC